MALKVHRRITQTVDDPELANRIRQAQEASGLSVSEVCRKLELSRTYWYKIINDNVAEGLTEATLRKIEAALNIELGVKFDG